MMLCTTIPSASGRTCTVANTDSQAPHTRLTSRPVAMRINLTGLGECGRSELGKFVGQVGQPECAEAERGRVPRLEVEVGTPGRPSRRAAGQPGALADLVGDRLRRHAEVADDLTGQKVLVTGGVRA